MHSIAAHINNVSIRIDCFAGFVQGTLTRPAVCLVIDHKGHWSPVRRLYACRSFQAQLIDLSHSAAVRFSILHTWLIACAEKFNYFWHFDAVPRSADTDWDFGSKRRNRFVSGSRDGSERASTQTFRFVIISSVIKSLRPPLVTSRIETIYLFVFFLSHRHRCHHCEINSHAPRSNSFQVMVCDGIEHEQDAGTRKKVTKKRFRRGKSGRINQ